MQSYVPTSRDKMRAFAAEVQAARLELWGRNCGVCGQRFVPDDLRRDMALKVCPKCLKRPVGPDNFSWSPDPRYALRRYGLETWD